MKKRYIWLTLVILFTCFIFARSLKSADQSSEESFWFVKLAVDFVKLFMNEVPDNIEDIMTFFIRKLAHITEYFIDGCLLCGFFSTFKGKVAKNAKWILLAGLLTACTDELLQYIPVGRSPEIRDVLVDFVGVVLALALYLAVRHIKNKRECKSKI